MYTSPTVYCCAIDFTIVSNVFVHSYLCNCYCAFVLVHFYLWFVIVYLKCTEEMMTVSLQEGGRSISLHNGHSRQPFLELNWISRSQQNSWRPDFFIYRLLFVQLDLLIWLFDNGDLQKNIEVYCATQQQRSKLFVQHWYQFNQGWSKKHWNCSDCIIACNAQEIPVCNACIMRLNLFSR